MQVQVLIVDDEFSSRQQLRQTLDKYPDLEIIGEAATAREALKLVEAVRYDAVFLDIHMPGASGLELARAIRDRDPGVRIIFVTAYEEYAVEAFNLRAVDYIVKPVSEERLAETIDRLLHSDERRTAPAHTPAITWVTGEKSGTKVPVPLEEIVFVSSEGCSVFVHTVQERLPTRFTLQDLTERLPTSTFFRCHRSYLINVQQVREIIPFINGTYLLKMKDRGHTEVPVSRSRTRELKHLFALVER